MQFHHYGYTSGDPRNKPEEGTGINRPPELPDEMDILIVDSGPAGMLLAAQLSQYPSITTRLIERRDGRLVIGHADGIQARSVETFQAFGFAERITTEAYQIREMNFWVPSKLDPTMIERSQRTPDDPSGISEFPHLNAMNNACTIQLNNIVDALREDQDTQKVNIRGEGRAFSTGIDLKELAAGQIEMAYHHRWERALRSFETMEKLIIAGINGYCLGGALQLALAADIRVGTADCQIGLPAIKESLIPGLGTLRLPRYIGWGRAKKMILGGQNIDGEAALRIGLVDHIVSSENFFTHLH